MITISNKEAARDLFNARIGEKGLRSTRQRDIILDAFLSAGNHITIEELHAPMSKNRPEIGYATLHRNLNLFRELGTAEEIKTGTRKTRYEQKVGLEHHDHLICIKCGAFIGVHDPKIERLQVRLAEQNDFMPLKHRLEVYGVCGQCG